MTENSETGQLAIVGCGINTPLHVTWETQRHIERAEAVLYFMADRFAGFWVEEVNSAASSLDLFHSPSKPRLQTFEQMVEAILTPVRAGKRTCAVFYGHPGVFARPAWDALRAARRLGYEARMFPAVSAEDCLFVDLEIDPGRNGLQSYDATDFLRRAVQFDSQTPLILWQISMTGKDTGPGDEQCDKSLCELRQGV